MPSTIDTSPLREEGNSRIPLSDCEPNSPREKKSSPFDKPKSKNGASGGAKKGLVFREFSDEIEENPPAPAQWPEVVVQKEAVAMHDTKSSTREPQQPQPEGGAKAPAPSADADAKFSFRPFFRGMREDLERRAPHYVSDWRDGCSSKVCSATFFMFFTSIAPAITFAGVLVLGTEDSEGVSQLGPVEVILSTFITGAMFAVLGGQPLCIVGVTGPVTIFTLACYTLAKELELPFVHFYCWVQIWAALLHMVLAAVNACEAIKTVTRYSCETFGMLIAIIYLYTGTRNLVTYFLEKDEEPALLSLVLGLGTAWLSLFLSDARRWSILTHEVRSKVADYGTTLAICFFCAVPYWGENYLLTPSHVGEETNMTIATLKVPDDFATTSGRAWFVNPFDTIPAWGALAAIVPGFILTVLFFFDHNVSSLLSQSPSFGLKKGTAYHWDYFMVGVMILTTGLLGIPPVNGLIPQAPLHTDALCVKRFRTKADGTKEEVIVHCHEQRVSGLLQASLIGCTLFYIRGIGYLPIAALDGLFLYMGIASFGGNSFYQRLVLFITDKERRDARHLDFLGKVPLPTVHKYTLLQLLILAIIFTITLLPLVDALFPVCIAILVPLRLYALPKWFGAAHVDALDAEGAPPDLDDEQLTPDGSPAAPTQQAEGGATVAAAAAKPKASGGAVASLAELKVENAPVDSV